MAATATTRDVGAYGRWLKKALWTPPAVAILTELGADTWLSGGCAVLALALKKVFGPRAQLVVIRAGRTGTGGPNQVEHVLVQVDGKYYLDGDGASAESSLLNRWRKVEKLPQARVTELVRRSELWDTGFYQDDESVDALAKIIDPAGVSKSNPGIIQRFAGGVLGKGHWILPEREFLERSRRALVARGMHRAGQPLEPRIEDALRAQHAEAVEVYGRGGPEAVDEWVKGVTGGGGRRGNPGGVAEAVANAVHRYNTLNEATRNAARDQHRYWTVEELGAVRSALDGLMAILADAGFRQSYSGRDGRPLPSSGKAYESRYGHVQLSEGGAHTAAHASFTPSGELKTLRRTSATRAGIRSRIDNPIDMITLLGAGVIAGAVQGIVEPFVTRYATRHVYRMDRSLEGPPRQQNGRLVFRQETEYPEGDYIDAAREAEPRMRGLGFTVVRTHDREGNIVLTVKQVDSGTLRRYVEGGSHAA